jgi:hypothetical protein
MLSVVNQVYPILVCGPHFINISPHMWSTNHKCTHTCFIPHHQCCSEDGEDVEYLGEELF